DLTVKRIHGAPAGGGVGVQQPDRLALSGQRRYHVGAPAPRFGQAACSPGAAPADGDQFGSTVADNLGLDERILEPERPPLEANEELLGGRLVGGVPHRQWLQLSVERFADKHSIEL